MAKSTIASQTFAGKLDRDHKRATDNRRKYAHGTTTGPGSDRVKPIHNVQRLFYNYPARDGLNPKPRELMLRAQDQRLEQKDLDTERVQGLWRYIGDSYDDDTADDGVEDSPDITYSFDYATGPSSGSWVLGAALDKAVARFEDRVTATLVHKEYSVVDAASVAGDVAVPENDDDFELV